MRTEGAAYVTAGSSHVLGSWGVVSSGFQARYLVPAEFVTRGLVSLVWPESVVPLTASHRASH